MLKFRTIASLFTALVTIFALSNVYAVTYRVTDLGNLGGSNYPPLGTHATALNNRGEVVGYSYTGSALHGFYWSAKTGIKDMGALTPGFSLASGINNAGIAVGHSTLNGNERAFRWTLRDGMQPLVTLGSFSQANSISNSGLIVGRSETADGEDHMALWKRRGAPRDLGGLPDPNTPFAAVNAMSVNSAGKVVGFRREQGFLWRAGSGFHDLGSLGSGRTYATDINELGVVVGSSAGAAFIWTKKFGIRSLGRLNGQDTVANALNNRGKVVGFGWRAGSFIWSEDTGMRDLNSLLEDPSAWYIQFANDINDKGQIAAMGLSPSGAEHALLLIPVRK